MSKTSTPTQLIEEYTEWIKKESTTDRCGEWCEVTLPLLDSSNDEISFYVKTGNNTISFTDDGFTVESFAMNGIDFTPARQQELTHIIHRFGAQLDDHNNIILDSTGDTVDALNRYVQALLESHAFLSLMRA